MEEEIDKIKYEFKKKYNKEVLYIGADLSKPQEIKSMIEEILEKKKSLDILVNNAGIQYVAPIEDFPVEKWDDIIAINLSSSFHTIKYTITSMKKQKWGRIINIASSHGLVASANKTGYVAAKHGLIGLTKAVALENAQIGITCNAICPGFVLTPLVNKQIEDKMLKGMTKEEATNDLLFEKHPSLQFVKTEDISAMVLLLAGENGSSITGASLSIDGGWTAR